MSVWGSTSVQIPHPWLTTARIYSSRPIVVPQDLFAFETVVIRVHFIVQVVNQTHDAPLILILTVFAGHVTHDALHRESMLDQTLVLVVFPQQSHCGISCWNSRFRHVSFSYSYLKSIDPVGRIKKQLHSAKVSTGQALAGCYRSRMEINGWIPNNQASFAFFLFFRYKIWQTKGGNLFVATSDTLERCSHKWTRSVRS